MAVDESARLDLFQGLEEVLGRDRAATLMAGLVLEGPEGLATKDDLRLQTDELRLEMGTRFQHVDVQLQLVEQHILAAVRGELITAVTTQTRTIMFTMVGAVIAMGGVAVSVAV